tara:strand:+ start:462 stop:1382 length:921 start_codon:yes stop_codon:yes gene_type:complete
MIKLKICLYNWLAKDLGKLGREGDTELAHVNTWEANLLRAHGGSGTINPTTGLREYKGGGGSTTTKSENTQNIDPAILPYITYGLGESQRLYQQAGPEYYPENTYVPMSGQTNAGLTNTEARATAGNPLLPAAQAQQLSTVRGDRLSAGNPYFADMMASAAKPAVTEFNKAIRDIGSRTAASGRYGSGAMGELESTASENLANALTSRAAELSYANYGTERGRQDAAIASAPQMAMADYGDMQQLLNVGQQREGYDKQSLQADIDRFSFGQNKPFMKLDNYLSGAYGAPTPMNTTSTGTSSGGGGK